MSLENRKILITAGPTWVPIDSVRVISNVSSGEAGLVLAKYAAWQGAKVTLLLGPVTVSTHCLDKGIRIIRFEFFDELKSLLLKELGTRNYDFLIHAAAVADYRLNVPYKTKISSSRKSIKLVLVPTPKIIDLVNKIKKRPKVVTFKLETGVTVSSLLKEARALIVRTKSEFVVANTIKIKEKRYKAYIVNSAKTEGPFFSKEDMAKRLIGRIGEMYAAA